MVQNILFTCGCGSTYELAEATRLGMTCPVCEGSLRRMDAAWAVEKLGSGSTKSRGFPRPSKDIPSPVEVAVITIPSRNENDMESVADLIRSLPFPLSLELFARGDRRMFLLRGSREILSSAAERLESAYPKLQADITHDDPVRACFSSGERTPMGAWVGFSKPGWLPIKTWESFRGGSDPVLNLASSFSGLSENEAVWLQLILAGEDTPPWEGDVQKRLKVESQRGYLVDESATAVSSPVQVRRPQEVNYQAAGLISAAALGLGLAVVLLLAGLHVLAGGMASLVVGGTAVLLRSMDSWGEDAWDRTDLRLVREKVINSHMLIQGHMRLFAVSARPERSVSLLRRLAASLHQYSISGGNALVTKKACELEGVRLWPSPREIKNVVPLLWLSPSEIAGLWHPPLSANRASLDGVRVNPIAFRAPSPDDVGGLSPIGDTRLPGGKEFPVHLSAQALRRGITMVGKPGMGKSVLMEHIVRLAAEDDPEQPAVVVVDPHGDLAERLLGVLSPEVVKDRVYYLDVAAKDYIMTYNPLDPTQRGLDPQAIAQIFMDIGQALFGKYWGPRMQIPYKRTILAVALANKKRGRGNMFGPNLITPFLMADEELWAEFIRQEIGDEEELTDLLSMYYQGQLANINRHLKQQVIMPVLSKADRFAEEPANSLYNPPDSDLDLWEVIKNRKILIINTRSGIIGEDMAAFTGALFINAIVKIVMHQIADRVKDRVPITFVVDEMQTIKGVRWDTILGQMRKHGFNLVIGTQSLASIRENMGDNMPGIILGGSHTLFSFRVNGEDAEKLAEEEFRAEEGGVDPTTLTQLPPYHVWTSMVGPDGKKIPPFSMRVRPPVAVSEAQIQAALDARATYSTNAKTAARQGMKSLTYIRDSFGKVLSEGSGGGAEGDSAKPASVRRGRGDELIHSLLDDGPAPEEDPSGDQENEIDDALRELESEAISMFDEEDLS